MHLISARRVSGGPGQVRGKSALLPNPESPPPFSYMTLVEFSMGGLDSPPAPPLSSSSEASFIKRVDESWEERDQHEFKSMDCLLGDSFEETLTNFPRRTQWLLFAQQCVQVKRTSSLFGHNITSTICTHHNYHYVFFSSDLPPQRLVCICFKITTDSITP